MSLDTPSDLVEDADANEINPLDDETKATGFRKRHKPQRGII